MASSNFPSRPFRLEEGVYLYGQNAWNAGNNSLIHSELWIRKNSYSPSWSASGGSFEMFVCGVKVGANGNFGFDFRNSDQLLLHASDNWFGHDGNGNLWVSSDGYASLPQLGYTEVHGGISVPRIPRPPSPPTATSIDAITTTSFGFRYTRGADNGAGISSDTVQWATDAAFSDVVWTDTGAAGYSNPGGAGVVLIPGKTYYVRVRSNNSAGTSGWSNTLSAKTLAALYVSDGTNWNSVEIYVSDGTTWKAPEIYYSDGSAWLVPESI
ncbi:minor tail protein [Microbacterium phage QMacho]|uniref:minor tail protein n=1 Tax=Microbacterium phage QMacho TaxID=2985325 RepID=UPI002430D36E|nr:minor tail protein [Microbacterium phage QMacho]UYL86679.1 minor tail protein [Microbacterium phage QMacho]